MILSHAFLFHGRKAIRGKKNMVFLLTEEKMLRPKSKWISWPRSSLKPKDRSFKKVSEYTCICTFISAAIGIPTNGKNT